MDVLFSPEVFQKISFLLYRYRFFISYAIIGFFSLSVEVFVFSVLCLLNVSQEVSECIGVLCGIVLAYWLNVRFNFKVPTPKRQRAFYLFVTISLVSAVINSVFNKQLIAIGWSYGEARFVIAGLFFSIAYYFHRKFSFSNFKKLGIAVYANGIEDIKGIFEKIEQFSDFIHVDIVDESFGVSALETRAYRLEAVRAFWMKKDMHVHIMSKYPSRWMGEVLKYADVVLVHIEMQEDINSVLDTIRASNKKAGLCITMDTDIDNLKKYIKKIEFVLLLSIAQPGKSGQVFDKRALKYIDIINKWKQRQKFYVCVDGGVNEQTVGMLNVEYVVSGSSVLNAKDPKKQILRLQTSSSYEST